MFEKLWASHKGRIGGIFWGLILSGVYLFFGFWDMLVVSFILLVCFIVGKGVDEGEPLAFLERVYKWLTEGWRMFR